MFIFIKTLSGKTISLDVELTETISSLKTRIQERENVPTVEQRILYAGKELEDSKDLNSYSIGKEAILHLVLKKSESHMSKLSTREQTEMKTAQSSKVAYWYNPSVGLNDELMQYKDSESKFDKHANPEGDKYDLGRDGQFKDFNLLIGQFDQQCILKDALVAMKKKGFGVDVAPDTAEFVRRLNKKHYHVAWIISGSHTSGDVSSFVSACMEFHKGGGGLMVWGDNDPYFVHANQLLPTLLKADVQLIGNTPGGTPMTVGKPGNTGQFGPHIITTGVIKLFEGITICYPDKLGPLKVLGTSSNGHPAVCYADNEALESETCGRVIVDCGWTKNYCSWHEAGTARYVSNATIWLLGLEHKIEKGDITEREEDPSTLTSSSPSSTTPSSDSSTTPSSDSSQSSSSSSSSSSQVSDIKKSPSKETQSRTRSVGSRLSGFFGKKS